MAMSEFCHADAIPLFFNDILTCAHGQAPILRMLRALIIIRNNK